MQRARQTAGSRVLLQRESGRSWRRARVDGRRRAGWYSVRDAVHLPTPLTPAPIGPVPISGCRTTLARLVALLWLIPLLGWGLELERYGVRPRNGSACRRACRAAAARGLRPPDRQLAAALRPGTAMLHLYPTAPFACCDGVPRARDVVWLFARMASTSAPAGLVYGMLSYVFVAGVLRGPARHRGVDAGGVHVRRAGLGVLPIRHGVSWRPICSNRGRCRDGHPAARRRHSAAHPLRVGRRDGRGTTGTPKMATTDRRRPFDRPHCPVQHSRPGVSAVIGPHETPRAIGLFFADRRHRRKRIEFLQSTRPSTPWTPPSFRHRSRASRPARFSWSS